MVNKRGEIPVWLGLLVLGLIILVILLIFNKQIMGFIIKQLGNLGRIL